MLLAQRHVALDAADDLITRGVHLPARPRLVEAVERDEAALGSVVAMAPLVILIPAHVAGEFGLRDGAAAKSEVDMVIEQRLGVHRQAPALIRPS
jgi:hypothetical protein